MTDQHRKATFGAAVRRIRKEDGRPITAGYLSDIERGNRVPTSDHMLRQFAAAAGLSADWLFYLADR